jgi:hypothetical protein
VGSAEAKLFPAQQAVDFATRWLTARRSREILAEAQGPSAVSQPILVERD